MATNLELSEENLPKGQRHGRHSETLQNFKKHVPLTLFAKNESPKNADEVLQEYLNAGSTLPRIHDNLVCKEEKHKMCIPPQVCLDDIKDPNLKKFVAKENYVSTYMKMGEDSVKVQNPKIEAPFTGFSPVVKLPMFETFPKVSPEWRQDSLKWSDQQYTSCFDLDKQLYQRWYKRTFNKDKTQG